MNKTEKDERILIDARYKDEIRVAIIKNDNELIRYESESISNRKSIKNNIYVAQIVRIVASMHAAFIDYGGCKNGFLSFSELRNNLFGELGENECIQDKIQVGQKILVQVTNDARGNKCATFTTFIAIPSKYCILIPYTDKQRIISKQIHGDERLRAEKILNSMEIPDNIGCIIRASGHDRSKSELNRDFKYLLRIWKDMQPLIQAEEVRLVYREGDIVNRTIRDFFNKKIANIIIQGEDVYKNARKFMKIFMPSGLSAITRYEDENIDFFNVYDINNKVHTMLDNLVDLPSGGNIVIEQTEALTSIDVNSGRMKTEPDSDSTALATNMEACVAIAKHIKLRDISGIIVIDFIDMPNKANSEQIEQTMSSLMREDYAHIKIGKISQFGLMEISRQRLRTSMVDNNFTQCPHCQGSGKILHFNTICMFLYRKIDEFLQKNSKPLDTVIVDVAPGIEIYILNHRRSIISDLENRHKIKLIIHGNTQIQHTDCKMTIKSHRDYHDNNHYQNNDKNKGTSNNKSKNKINDDNDKSGNNKYNEEEQIKSHKKNSKHKNGDTTNDSQIKNKNTDDGLDKKDIEPKENTKNTSSKTNKNNKDHNTAVEEDKPGPKKKTKNPTRRSTNSKPKNSKDQKTKQDDKQETDSIKQEQDQEQHNQSNTSQDKNEKNPRKRYRNTPKTKRPSAMSKNKPDKPNNQDDASQENAK